MPHLEIFVSGLVCSHKVGEIYQLILAIPIHEPNLVHGLCLGWNPEISSYFNQYIYFTTKQTSSASKSCSWVCFHHAQIKRQNSSQCVTLLLLCLQEVAWGAQTQRPRTSVHRCHLKEMWRNAIGYYVSVVFTCYWPNFEKRCPQTLKKQLSIPF